MHGQQLNSDQKGLLEMEFLIRVCHQGGYVVDLCCGSGSGCVAGLRMGHHVAGFDISTQQVAGAIKRLELFSTAEVRLSEVSNFVYYRLPCSQL